MTDPQPDAPPTAAPVRDRTRTSLAVVGLVLVGLMVVLGYHGPRFVAVSGSEGDLAVTCGSLLTVGWPTDGSFRDTESGQTYGDHVRSGEPDSIARQGIARDCSERRDTYLALMVLLAVPASVCLSAAAARRRPAQPV